MPEGEYEKLSTALGFKRLRRIVNLFLAMTGNPLGLNLLSGP